MSGKTSNGTENGKILDPVRESKLRRSRKRVGSVETAVVTSAPASGTNTASAEPTPTAAPNAAAPPPTKVEIVEVHGLTDPHSDPVAEARAEIEKMREILGIKSLERNLERLEVYMRGNPMDDTAQPGRESAAPTNQMNTILASVMAILLPKLPELLEAGMGMLTGANKAPAESILWQEIEHRYDEVKRHDMKILADKVVSGFGLIVEDTKSPDDIGKPDGKGLQK